MNKKQGGYSVIEVIIGVLLLATIATIGFFIFQQNQHKALSAEQIEKKFECNRMTADARQTDVFCKNPKFYNNPDSVAYEDYYKYYRCDERLRNNPPAESYKQIDPSYYNAYYACKDTTKLEGLRQDFIKELKKLKAANS